MMDSYDEWGDLCYENGYKLGRLEVLLQTKCSLIEVYIRKLGLSFEEACIKAGIPEEILNQLQEKLNK